MADDKNTPAVEDISVPGSDRNDPKLETVEDGSDSSLGYPEGGLQAWLVVSGASAVMFCTFGYLTGFGIYQQWYSEHQLKSYSLSDISWIGSVQIFLNFAGGLVGGPVLDRYGSVMMIPASLVYVVSLILTSFCHEYYQFFLAQAVLGGICLGLMFSTSLAIVGHYFNARQGLALGIVMAGAAVGGVVFPIALNRMLNSVGLSFGWSVRVCALIMLVLLAYANLTMKTRLPPTSQPMNFSLMRRPVYVLVAAGGWLLNWGMYVPLFYLPSFATTAGASAAFAPYTVAIFNAASIFGRVSAGTLADRLGCLNVVVLNGLLCAATLFVWAAFGDAHQSAGGVVAVAVLEGLFIGSIVSLQAAVVARVTPDPRYLGSMMGVTMTIWACGGLTGPPIAGAILAAGGGAGAGAGSTPGSYDGAGYFGGASLVAGSVLFLAARMVTESRLFVRV